MRASPGGVAIDYQVRAGSAGPARPRTIGCRFAVGQRTVLDGISLDGRELAGATVYLLQREFIDTPDGAAADPGPPAWDADLAELPARTALLLQHLLSGLPGMAVYGLLASAYGLLFGLVGRINLAFGELAAVGAVATGLAVAALAPGGGAALAWIGAGLAVGVAAAALHGFAASHAAFVSVPARSGQASLIATVGLSLALSEYLRLAGGVVPAWIPPIGAEPIPIARSGPFVVTLTGIASLTAAIGFAAAIGLVALMRTSGFGRAWRAAADDPAAAALCGIDLRRLFAWTAVLSGGLAGLAGALVAVRFGALGFADGFSLGLKALAGAILGGIGSVPGALLGGLAIGLFETLWSALFPIAWGDLAVYLALAVTVATRPQGFGRGGLLPDRLAGPARRLKGEGAVHAVTIADIEAAAALLEGRILRTPTVPAPGLSELTGATVFVKHENMQATGSFKERGALNKLASLTEAEAKAGIVAMSAGNHAAAVAYHAKRLGIPAIIVMPVSTPLVKAENTRAHGAEVVLKGETLFEAAEEAAAIGRSRGATLVHPYDDPRIIAGQGTLALEMLEDAPDLDDLVVPIGGGGLISGIAVAAKARRPGIRIVGAEAALFPSFANALRGEDAPIGGPTLAEGIAVKTVGRLTLPIVRDLVSEVVCVEEALIERAVAAFATLSRTMAEGAGAAGLAAMLARPDLFAGRRVGLVLCGGNIDARLLASVMVRELERCDRIASFRITTGDRPGLLGEIASRLGALGANILEVSHGRLFLDVPAKGVSVDVTIETRNAQHTSDVLLSLATDGLNPRRIGPSGLSEPAY